MEVQEDWTTISRLGQGRKRKPKGNADCQDGGLLAQINLTPTSFANVAAKAAHLPQKGGGQSAHQSATVMEITVLRSRGLQDRAVETAIQARPAYAIARAAHTAIEVAVAKPIHLKAGQWSFGLNSRGNYIYVFDGLVPFDTTRKYKKFLLQPFPGGQLCPTLGWTCFLAHGVPALDKNNRVFGPDQLNQELQQIPGLSKVHFALPPHWLHPVEWISGSYSSITFMVSDLDGSIFSSLLLGHHALFRKEIHMEKWVDKPTLVQGSRCHSLGHNSAS